MFVYIIVNYGASIKNGGVPLNQSGLHILKWDKPLNK